MLMAANRPAVTIADYWVRFGGFSNYGRLTSAPAEEAKEDIGAGGIATGGIFSKD